MREIRGEQRSRGSSAWARLAALCLALALASCRSPEVVAPEKVGLSAERLAAVPALLRRTVGDGQLAGAVVLVARHDEVALLEAVGFQDRETGVPMDTSTIFRICSMTKPVTSFAALLLADEGRLALTDPVERFLPEFRGMKVAVPRAGGSAAERDFVPAERSITILDLLTHTSGLTYTFFGDPYFGPLYTQAGVTDGLVETDSTADENARRLAGLPLMHQPGSAWSYSLATDVLGRVVEVASGLTLDELFRQRIFEPLDMRDTHFRLPAAKRQRLAAVYQPGPDGKIEALPTGTVRRGYTVYSASYPTSSPGTYLSGGAGLVSTARDYSRFLRMLARGGELDGKRLLSKGMVALMTRDHCAHVDGLFKNHGDGFGLGVGVVTDACEDKSLGSVGTISWGGFYYTYFWVDPAEELIGVVMAQLHPWGDLKVWDEVRKLTYAAIAD